MAILEIFCAHDAHSTAGVNNVVEFNYARGAVLLAGPGGRHGATRVLCLVVGGTRAFVGRKFNGGDFGAIEDLSAALARMSEDKVVGLGADDVPRIGVFTTGANEVGDCGD